MSELLDKVKERKNFYRDYYRLACNALWIALVLIVLLSLATLHLNYVRPDPNYYATSNSGKLVKLTPLDSPNYSHTPLIE